MSGASCPLCGYRDTRPSFLGLTHCRQCDHRFDPSAIGAGNPAELYGESYFRGAVYKEYLGEAALRTRLFAEKTALVGALIPKSGSVLDVGCATGYFLALMRRRGYRVQGVEISEFAAVHARKNAGVEIYVGQLPEAGLPSESFDLVCFWDTLEHLSDPVCFLREAHRILKNLGLLLVETMNVHTLSRLLLGERWPLLAPPYHLQYFSRRSLLALLEREGFRVVRAVPIQTYVGARRRVRAWRYYRSPLLRGVIGPLAGDVVLYAAAKVPARDPAESSPADRPRFPRSGSPDIP